MENSTFPKLEVAFVLWGNCRTKVFFSSIPKAWVTPLNYWALTPTLVCSTSVPHPCHHASVLLGAHVPCPNSWQPPFPCSSSCSSNSVCHQEAITRQPCELLLRPHFPALSIAVG
jgi:hypothetical protein